MRSISSPTFRSFLLAALCAGLVLAAGCARHDATTSARKPASPAVDHQPKPPAPPKKNAIGDDQSETPKITITQRGVTLRWDTKNGTQMTASAKSGSFNEVTQVGTLLDFSAKLYENGKLTAAIIAPEATADTAKRVVLATGGVTLKSVERETTVHASWIRWMANTHKIVGNGGVTITSASGSIEGAAFIADTDLRTLTVTDSGKGL